MNPLTLFFFREVQDHAVPPLGHETPYLSHIASILAPIYQCDPGDVAARLALDLERGPNPGALAKAEAERAQGEHHPYTLVLNDAKGRDVPLLITPRPVLSEDNAPQTVAGITPLDRIPFPDHDEAAGHGNRFFEVAAASRIGTWEWDVVSGRMQLSSGLKAMLGYGEEDIEDHVDEWEQLIHGEDREPVRQAVKDHFAGRSPFFEVSHRMLHKDGGIVWLQARGMGQRDSSGKVVRMLGMDMDITQSKLAEQAVDDERQRLFTLLDRLPAFVCLIAPDYSIPFANRQFREEFGNPGPMPCYSIMNGRKAPCKICPTFEVFETQSLSSWEWQCNRTQKTYQVYDYPFQDLDGSPLVLELGMDVTQKTRAQELLKESEERYRSITDNLPLGIAVIDQTLRITAANPLLTQWFPEVDFASMPHCSQIFAPHPDTADVFDCGGEKIFSQAAITEHLFETGVPWDDPGSRRSFRVTACPMFTENGDVGSIIGLVEDVTEKLMVEEKLKRAERVEALGTLAGGIAHEINQPLNALQLYVSGLEMMLDSHGDVEPETLRIRLGWVLRESAKIRDIISHMRSLVQQQDSRPPSPTDLNHVVEKALTLMGTQMRNHGIELTLELDPGAPLVRANPVQLEQVVLNLAINAIQAFATRNSMESLDVLDKRVLIATRTGEEWTTLLVRDNGPGLGQDEDRIFDPFYSTKESGRAMGLGLSIVHSFLKAWGGEITGRNNELGGADFSVRLVPA